MSTILTLKTASNEANPVPGRDFRGAARAVDKPDGRTWSGSDRARSPARLPLIVLMTTALATIPASAQSSGRLQATARVVEAGPTGEALAAARRLVAAGGRPKTATRLAVVRREPRRRGSSDPAVLTITFLRN